MRTILGFMKGNGRMIKGVGKDMKGIKVATLTKASLKTIKLMGEVFINGRKEKFTMASGGMGKRMAMEFGKASLGIAILESGRIVKQRDMVFMFGKMEINMKENGLIV